MGVFAHYRLRRSLSLLRNASATTRLLGLGYFDGAYLSAKFAHVFRDLGRPKEAERFARRSLDMIEGYDRGKLFNMALLASTLADQRRIEEACTAGAQAVQMTETVRSVRTLAYLANLDRKLTPFRQHTAVKDLLRDLKQVGAHVPDM